MPAIIQGVLFFIGSTGAFVENWSAGLALAAAGAFLLAGLLTPLAALVVAILTIAVGEALLSPPQTNLFNAPLPITVVTVVAVAIALLGPGCVSLDCRLFGRREIIIPRAPESSDH